MYDAFWYFHSLALLLLYSNPLICFLFVAVILPGVPSSCQSGMAWVKISWFLFFEKVQVRISSAEFICSCSGRVLQEEEEELP